MAIFAAADRNNAIIVAAILGTIPIQNGQQLLPALIPVHEPAPLETAASVAHAVFIYEKVRLGLWHHTSSTVSDISHLFSSSIEKLIPVSDGLFHQGLASFFWLESAKRSA
jgi:hypothetical protein